MTGERNVPPSLHLSSLMTTSQRTGSNLRDILQFFCVNHKPLHVIWGALTLSLRTCEECHHEREFTEKCCEGTLQNTLLLSEGVTGHVKIPPLWRVKGHVKIPPTLRGWRDTSKYYLTEGVKGHVNIPPLWRGEWTHKHPHSEGV